MQILNLKDRIILCCLVFLCTIALVEAHFEDVRCKCVCPPASSNSSSQRTITVSSFQEPEDCKCHNVVDAAKAHLCDKCECKWSRRNTTTIMVVVILIICVVALLFLYMLFLLCLDPLMSRRPRTYLEHQNEEVNLDTQSLHRVTDDGRRPRPDSSMITRVRHEVHRVRDEQQRWKGTVQEQRRNIFDRHTMLN